MNKQQLYELIEEIEQEIQRLKTSDSEVKNIKKRILQLCEDASIGKMMEDRVGG